MTTIIYDIGPKGNSSEMYLQNRNDIKLYSTTKAVGLVISSSGAESVETDII